jgi:hypothetical protein
MSKSVSEYRSMLLKEELDANDIFSDVLFTVKTEGEGDKLNDVEVHSWGKTYIIRYNDFEAIRFSDGEIDYKNGDVDSLKQILDSF